MKRMRLAFITLIIFCSVLVAAYAEQTLTWGDCLIEAKKNNPNLISAEEVVNQQKAAKAIAASPLYPQINASAQASTSKTTVTNPQNDTTSTSTNDSYSYDLSASQLVFDGFKTLNQVNAAKENIKGAQQNYRFVSSDVRLNLRNAFISLLWAQELINVTEEIVKIRRDNLQLITLQYQSGLEHRGALLTAQANLLQATFELDRAKRDVEFAQRKLSQQMGQREFKPMFVKADFIVRESAKEKPDFEIIVKNNPSVLQALAKENAAAFNIKSAYAEFFPQLSGSTDVGKSSSHWPPENNQWNAGLSVNMPIFEGGLRLAQVSQAQAAYKQAREDGRSTHDAAVVALEQGWATLQNTMENIAVQQKSLEANEERSKIAQVQYATGFISFDNWIIIEDDLVNAKKTYLLAQVDSLFAEANWIYAKGETLEYAQ